MKVLIADDEYLVRSSLTSMLKELDMPLEIVGEATNGEELVDMIKSYSPDVAFVDIRMPKLNGLDAIKAAKNYSPNTQWIILTGFSEFDYAKEAIKLGASSYLLKPASPEELKEILIASNKRCMENSIILNKEFENELIALNHDLSPFPVESEVSGIGKVKFICSIFIFDSYLNEKKKAELQFKYCNAVRAAMSELPTNEARLALFPMSSGELAAVGAWGARSGDKGRQLILKYFDRVSRIALQFNSEEFSITILQSDDCESYQMLYKRLYQIQNLAPLRVIMSVGKKYAIDELTAQYEKTPSNILKLCSELIKLSAAYKEKVYLNYMKSLEEFEKILASSNAFYDNNLKKPIAEFLTYSVNCAPDSCSDTRELVKLLKNHGEGLLAENQKEDNSALDITNQIMSFIEQNYMYDIGIGQIAEKMDITPNYLSSLFHKKTGTTFMKYLTKVRMLKARELLSNPGAQVQQVAEKVGYYSTRHFTKLFTEHYGFYPSECRDKFVK